MKLSLLLAVLAAASAVLLPACVSGHAALFIPSPRNANDRVLAEFENGKSPQTPCTCANGYGGPDSGKTGCDQGLRAGGRYIHEISFHAPLTTHLSTTTSRPPKPKVTARAACGGARDARLAATCAPLLLVAPLRSPATPRMWTSWASASATATARCRRGAFPCGRAP